MYITSERVCGGREGGREGGEERRGEYNIFYYIYIYIERERDWEREREKEREREREREIKKEKESEREREDCFYLFVLSHTDANCLCHTSNILWNRFPLKRKLTDVNIYAECYR